jgi:hypothetical protein
MGGMTPAWMQQLAPDHAPPPPGWWPPAPGWWLLSLLLLVALALALHAYFRPPRRLRRLALRELARLERAAAGDDAALARGLEHLLRRYALSHFGRDQVARLNGEEWLAFVVGHGGKALAGSAGASLLRAAYGGGVAAERERWLAGARAFLRGRP